MKNEIEIFNPGCDLLSHTLAGAVPSALEGLTSGFGMVPGVSPPVWQPGNNKTKVVEVGG